MAASEETCDGNPNFAIICSFITKFGDDCGVNFSIPYLQQMLEDTKNVNDDLQELLIHLLRRGRKRVNKERWEKCLIKFCHEYSSVDAWEIERFGFTKAKLSVKLEILKRLLELQFDANAKFKAEVNKLDAGSLRLLPLGRDIDGQAYWYQLDKEYNIRLYRETIGEEGAWQLLCSNTEDIRKLLTTLEKKYSGSAGDMCEDKSNDSNPKSPSSDMLPVPKKELDTEDLTSHLSESKPCTIIIKTEKRDTVSHSEVPSSVKNENCAIDTEKKAIGCEIDNSTKGSVKLKLKLEPSVHSRTEHKSSDRTVVECSAVIEKAAVVVLDAEPMEVETSKPVSPDVDLQPKSVPVDDVEMVEESASTDKVRSESKREEQSDQNFSTKNNNPTVVIDNSNSVNHHKSSKIRLYEKWSSEKKKLESSKPSVEECNIDSKHSSVVEEKDQSFSVTSNQKNDPAIPLKHPSEQSGNSELVSKQTDLSEQSKCTDNETAVDLSKSSRVNVIVQNMCSKPVLSNGVSSATKSNTEKSEKGTVGNFDTSNLETTKKSDSSRVSFEKSHESSLELKYKPLETESNKAHKRTQSYADCYDTSVITKTGSVSGFSHLQALQNMCESNAMGGIPSVIQSTNRCSVESNRTVISETKSSVNCDVRYESMSRKYTFSDVHCSNDKTLSSGSETINMVLKSNVQKSEDERHKKMEIVTSECQGKNKSSSFHAIMNEQESSQEAPTDLSCSDHTKPDICDLKSSENLNKTSASTVNKSDTLLIKENIEVDVKEKEKIEFPEKTRDLSRKNICATKQHDNVKSRVSNLCSSSEKNIFLDPSAKSRENPDEQIHATDLSCGKAETNTSESAIKSNKTVSRMSEVSSERPYSDNLQRDEHKKFSEVRKDISVIESVKEPDKSNEPNDTILEQVSKSVVSSSSLDNCKDEILVSEKPPTNFPKSALKESDIEPVTELKEPVEAKSKFVKNAPMLLKETDSTLKACFKTPETAKKEEKIVSISKDSGSVAERKASVDTQIADKEKKVITNELHSKPSEIPYSDEEKCPENEFNASLQSEAGEANENVIRSSATVGCVKSKTVNSKKEELVSALDKVIHNDVPGKSSLDYSPSVDCKIQASELYTSDGMKPMKEDNFEKLAEKTKDVAKISEKEIDVEKISKKEADVKKAPENKMDAKKVSRSNVGVKNAPVSEMNIEHVSESKMDAKKISENKLNTERLLEKGKDDKNISVKEIDVGKASENEKDVGKTCESGKDVVKASENKVGEANICENKMDVSKAPENEMPFEKFTKNKKDAEKVSEDKEDVIKVAENKKKDAEKVSENEMHVRKAFEEADLKKISDNEMDIDKVSDKDIEMGKIFETEMDLEKVHKDETDVEKVCENERDVKKVTEIEMGVEKICENERDVKKVVETEKDVKEVVESLNDALKVAKSEKLVTQAAEHNKEDIKGSKSRRESEKVSQNEKDSEKVSEGNEDVIKASEKKKDPEKISKSLKECSNVVKISKNEKDSEKVSKSNKDVVKASENEKDLEKVSKRIKDAIKVSENEKDSEKVSKSNKDVVKEFEDEKNLEKVSKSNKDAVKVLEKKEDSEKVSKSNKDAVKVSENERDSDKVSTSENKRATEKVSENEKNSEKVSESKQDIVKISKNEKDGGNAARNEKGAEKVSEKEKDSEKVSKGEKDPPRSSKKEKEAEKISENEKDSEKVSEHEKNAEKISEKEECVEKVSKIEKSVEKVSEQENKGEKVFANKGDAEKISLKEVNIEHKNKKEEDFEKVTAKEKEVKKVSMREKHVEKVTKNEKGSEKMSKNEMDMEKVSKEEKNVERVPEKEKDVEKKSKGQKDLAVVHKNKMENEKVSGREKDINKVPENLKDEEKLSKKHKVSKNQNDVKKVLENKKCDAEISQIEKNAEKISKNETDTEKLSVKESSNTVEESKSKLHVDNCETIEEIDKLDNKSCSPEKNNTDSKSEKYRKSTNLNDESKEKSLQKELNERNKKLSSPKDDSDLKLNSDSLVEIDNEKSMESKTDFSDKDDKTCSKIDAKDKLKEKYGEKSEVLSEKNCSDPQNIDCSVEKDCKTLKDKTGENNDSSANEKDVEMPDICSSKATDELSVVMKPEDTCKKSDIEDGGLNDKKVENISKTRKSKGRSGRKALFTRRKNRNKKDSSLEVSNIKTNCDTVSRSKVGKRETEDLSVALNIEESTVSSAKEADECNKSVLKFEVPYEEQLKVYNLRHGICLETKFKHPFCDKYVKKTREFKNSHVLSECTIELTNDENLLANFNEVSPASTKTRTRGKNSKQQVNKKPESVPTPVTKSVPSAKKTQSSSTKKRQSRGRKKEDLEKDDFAIPEGFLEILGNAENTSSDKGVSGKKRKGYELKDSSASQQNSENESAPIKRSRRIQEQHQKKMTELAVEMEREQRILEQLAKRSNNAKRNAKNISPKPTPKSTAKGLNAKINAKGSGTPTKSPKARAKLQTLAAEEETCMESRRATRKMNSRSKNLTKMTLMYEDESKDSQFSTSRETEKSKRRRRGRGQKKGFRPWDVSSESESSIEELTEEEEEEPEEPLIFDVNEDEFACEEVDPNAEPVIVRRARTAKKTEIEDTAEECINDDTPCKKCGKYDKPEWILLCDKCDSGYHTHCLIPPLMIVPDGDWFCQPCEHMSLCQCLHEELSKLEVVLKQREREELRKQRLAYVGISLDNVLKPEKKEKSDESEKEEEAEEKIKEEDHKPPRARQSVDDERQQKLYGKRSVRARRNVNYQFKEYDALIASALQEELLEVPEEDFKEEEDGSEAGSDKPFTAKISKRKKRGRRWRDLDFSDEDSEDEYQGGSTDSEATMPPSSNSDQESGSGEWKISKSKKKPQKKPSKSRRRRRGGDSSEEDWEDEIADNEAYRPTTRRAAQKAISYRELSSDDEEEWSAKPQAAKKRRKASSSESEASFKRKPSKKKRIRKWASSDSSESEEEKSMSSSEGESEEERSQEDESENEWKIDRKEKIMRLKSNTNKKVLSSEDDEESSTRDSVPKKQPKKVISDESEEEDEEEEEEESESEENSEESEEEEDEEEDKEKKVPKKPSVPEKKVPPDSTSKIIPATSSKPDAETKEIPTEKAESASEKKSSMDKPGSLSITESREFQPKVLVKKELCSVDIPLEPIKQTVTITPVVDKTPPKTVRKETTKMVPCVIPYDKSPKSGHASNPEEESDKETSKEEEMQRRVPTQRPAHFPKQSTTVTSPSSRIQFGGVLARHTVPPLSSSVRPPIPPSSVPPRMIAPTNLSTRPSAVPSVVVRHTAPTSNMPARPNIPSSKMPVPPSTPSTTAPATQTVQSNSESKSYKSTIMEPFSNMDDENDSDDEVPLERIPNACVPAPLPNRPVSYEREAEYRPAAKELSSYSYAPPEEKPFPGSYSSLAPFQDYSARPSPLKPSLVETYPNNSSPSKLTPLDTYSQTSSPKGFISLDSYSENRKKKHFFGNASSEADAPHRPPPSSSENFQGGEIRFPPEPYPCPQSPTTYPNRSPSPTPRDPGTPPRLYSQFPDAYAPPRSPEYYQNHQYYASEERIPRPSYQPNYAPQEPSFVSNPYVATPVPQPNGGFMIDTLLRARNHENEEDELTGVTDIVTYITQE